jgi:hypothetical protein
MLQGETMLVSVTGFIGSGKDTVADYLITEHGFKKESWAGSLKDAVASVFGWERDLLEGTTKYAREWREQVDPWWSERLGIKDLTPRYILQQWGTEVCRHHFHPDIWVASLENKLRQSKDDVVITDTRFPDEMTAIKSLGGITIRIHRGPKPDWYDDAIAVNKGPRHIGWSLGKDRLNKLGIHPSEYSSVGLNYDHEIHNDSTIDDLYSCVKHVLELY